jgi:hypothetical protein
LVGGHSWTEQDAANEPCRHGIGVEGLKSIAHAQGAVVFATLNAADASPDAIVQRCDWGPGAQAAWDAFAAEIDDRSEHDAEYAAFWSRAAEMVQRLALILSVSRAGCPTEVTAEAVEWGIAIARASFGYTLEAGRDFIADTEPQARAQEIVRALKARGGKATHRELMRALAHKFSTRDVRDTLVALEESGRIHADEDRSRPGRPVVRYRLG